MIPNVNNITPGQPRNPDIVQVNLTRGRHDIVVGENLLATVGTWLAPVLRKPKVTVLADEAVRRTHLPLLLDGLRAAGIGARHLFFSGGEENKTLTAAAVVADRLLEAGAERRDTLVVMGGGVTGDVGGFAAAITLRGIGLVHVPTTLLAQVDSAIGGKTGVNTAYGKNLVGAFYQPQCVIADTRTLTTLPRRHLRAGYAEIVKYGLITDSAFFAWLEENGHAIINGDAEVQGKAISWCCRIKGAIVSEDPEEGESGRRGLLNFGHTFAHALETALGHRSVLLHGEAVGLGMVLATAFSVFLNLCSLQEGRRIRDHLAAVGLPARRAGLIPELAHALRQDNIPALIALMRRDKKNINTQPVFILLRGIGCAVVAHSVPVRAVEDFLHDWERILDNDS